MMAPGMHDGFPFPIREASGLWDGADFTVDPGTVCGPGTRYPVGMTIQQMAQLYWRAKAYKLTVSCAASNYGVSDYSTAFNDMTWEELDTPGSNLGYYQIGQPEDTTQNYPEDQPDNNVPWMLILAVYQVNTGQAIPESQIPPAPGTMEGTHGYGYMIQYAQPWMLRLFEYGAMRVGVDYYPSIELTLMPRPDGPVCGSVSVASSEVAHA